MMKYHPILLLTVCALFSELAYSDQCTDIQKQAARAYSADNIINLKKLRIKANSSCDGSEQTYVARQLAYLMYKQLEQSKPNDHQLIQGLGNIKNIFPEFWPALADLAEYYEKKQQYHQAAVYYEKAIDAIHDPDKTPHRDAPNSQKLQFFYSHADSMKAASDQYVASKSRGFGTKFRNRHLPIHFDFGRKDLRGSDQRYAQDLLKALRRAGSPSISLIGHTDPVGSAQNNYKLSMARSKTVKNYLIRHGYTGTIRHAGKGEYSPLPDPHANPTHHYGRDKWHRMLRRVQVIVR